MKLKTNEISGTVLDVAVALAIGGEITRARDAQIYLNGMHQLCGEENKRYSRYVFSPSTDWKDCGDLIHFHQVCLIPVAHDGEEGTENSDKWYANVYFNGGNEYTSSISETPLIAVCRAIVGMKFGDFVDLPDDLRQ